MRSVPAGARRWSSRRRSTAPTPGGALTDTERAYSGLDLRLYYSHERSASFSGNQPALAAPPSTGEVTGTVKNRIVTFSTRATGDPSAGVQEVWVTWTGGPGAGGHGQWRSVDLTQDPTDSTHWTGTLRLPDGQSFQGVRFVVQAANGVGAVGLDTADGDGYRVTPEGDAPPPPVITPATPAHGTVGTAYHTELAATGGTAPLFWGVAAGSALPDGLTLGLDGAIDGTPTTPGTTTFTATVTDSLAATAEAVVTIIVDPPPAPVISPVTPTRGTVGVAYRTDLAATGSAPLSWSLAAGSALPAGLTLSAAGTIAGTPTAPGTTTFTVRVTDRYGSSSSTSLTITVDAPPAPVITPVTPARGTVGVAYRTDLAATGSAPLSWSVAPGSTLPAGLTLSAGGSITGTPTKAGSTAVTVRVTDRYGSSSTVQLTMVVDAAATRLVAARVLDSQPLVLSATLTHARTNAPLAGQTVVFKVRKVTLCTSTTNAQGLATCDLRRRPLDVILVFANLGFDASFAGTADYQGSTGSARLTSP